MSSTHATASPPVLAYRIPRPSTEVRVFAADAALILLGVIAIALLAKVSVSVGPIPVTGQTLGVIIVGCALGARRGALGLTTYMLVGLAGLPVFAGPLAGPAYVLAPSFGFVLGFIPAAFVAGWFAERTWDRKPLHAMGGFVVASVVPFLIGVPYMALTLGVVLSQSLTFESLMMAGVAPFIIPGLFKAAIAAVVIPMTWKLVSAADRRARS